MAAAGGSTLGMDPDFRRDDGVGGLNGNRGCASASHQLQRRRRLACAGGGEVVRAAEEAEAVADPLRSLPTTNL